MDLNVRQSEIFTESNKSNLVPEEFSPVGPMMQAGESLREASTCADNSSDSQKQDQNRDLDPNPSEQGNASLQPQDARTV